MQQITADQIQQFIAVVRTGNVSRGEFQRRLEEPNSLVEFFRFGPAVPPWHKEAVKFWKSYSPGHGEALVELLAPFYQIDWAWKENHTPFPVQRGLTPTASLKKRCREAIFWMPWQEPIVTNEAGNLWESLDYELPYSLLDSIKENHWSGLWDAVSDLLEDSIQGNLENNLKNLDEGFRESLGEGPWDSYQDEGGVSLWDKLQVSLWYSLAYACMSLLIGDEGKLSAFRELLSLWAEGIILAGFDGEGRLVIYSPPAES